MNARILPHGVKQVRGSTGSDLPSAQAPLRHVRRSQSIQNINLFCAVRTVSITIGVPIFSPVVNNSDNIALAMRHD